MKNMRIEGIICKYWSRQFTITTIKCLLKLNVSRVNLTDYIKIYISRAKSCQYYVYVVIFQCIGQLCISILQLEYFALCSFFLYFMVFYNQFFFKCFVSNIQLLLKVSTYHVVDFIVLTSFSSNLNSLKLSH